MKITITSFVVAAGLGLMIAGCAHKAAQATSPTPEPVVFHPMGGVPGQMSTNLDEDIRLMWGVGPREQGRAWVASTPGAVEAANRVFNTIDLAGMTMEEVNQKLRFDLRSQDYGYVAPYWPVVQGVLPIRIDTGLYGWQFDIHFDKDKKVSKVARRWVH